MNNERFDEPYKQHLSDGKKWHNHQLHILENGKTRMRERNTNKLKKKKDESERDYIVKTKWTNAKIHSYEKTVVESLRNGKSERRSSANSALSSCTHAHFVNTNWKFTFLTHLARSHCIHTFMHRWHTNPLNCEFMMRSKCKACQC